MLIDYSPILHLAASFAGLTEFNRFISIIYIPVVLLFFSLVESTYQGINNFKIKKLIAITLIIWSLYPTTRAVKNSIEWNNYSSPSIEEATGIKSQ
ncbi:MAG: hypothetical protein OCD76_13525 [Reichenbachiella sp.]